MEESRPILGSFEQEFLEDLAESFGERAETFSEGLRQTLFELWSRARIRTPNDAPHSSSNISFELAKILHSDSLNIIWDGSSINVEEKPPDVGPWAPLYLHTQTGEVLARGKQIGEAFGYVFIERQLSTYDGYTWTFPDPQPRCDPHREYPKNLLLLVNDKPQNLDALYWGWLMDENGNKQIESVDIPGGCSADIVVARFSMAKEVTL